MGKVHTNSSFSTTRDNELNFGIRCTRKNKTADEKRTADPLPRTVDADITITSVRHIMYEQFQLDDNFRTYLEGVMLSDHVLRTLIKHTPYQKSF